MIDLQEARNHETLSSNKRSRFNPVPSVYLYFALFQLLSTLIINEDITLALRYSEEIYLKEEEKARKDVNWA